MTKLTIGPLVAAAMLFTAGVASADELPSAVSQFKDSAHKLGSSRADDAMHVDTVATMRDMASALRAIHGIGAEHANAIEAQANAIERSKPTSRMHEDAAKSALEHAIAGLRSLPECSALSARLPAARVSVGRINEDRPFLKQKSTIDNAFREVADAIEAAAACRREVAVVVPKEETQPVAGQLEEGETHNIKLSRKLFDTIGDTADFDSICGGAGVKRFKYHRNRRDIAAGVFTAGFYTPVHLEVVCNPKH